MSTLRAVGSFLDAGATAEVAQPRPRSPATLSASSERFLVHYSESRLRFAARTARRIRERGPAGE